MTHEPIHIHDLPCDEDFIRLPVLFRRWELNDVIELGADFLLEDAGEAADGTQLKHERARGEKFCFGTR